MTLPLTAHQRIALQRRFPGVQIEERTVSSFRVIVDGCFVHVHRPPFAGWVISWPYVAVTMLHPASEHEIWPLRAMLLGWMEGSKPDR
jgi:hypothetical protein